MCAQESEPSTNGCRSLAIFLLAFGLTPVEQFLKIPVAYPVHEKISTADRLQQKDVRFAEGL